MNTLRAILVLLCCTAHAAEHRLATFRADVTIPIGHACMGGGIAPAKEMVDPLFANGCVLLGADKPIVFVAVDWCEIRNDAYDDWRKTLAEAAGTEPVRVLMTSVHQHDAPVVDYAAQRLLDSAGLPKALCDVDFAKEALGRVAAALREALPKARRVTHYGIGQARVEGVASNRRIVSADGSVAYARGSATKEAAWRAQPEGLIDPYLKTLSFWDGDTPVAALSAYATHPMSYYGKGGVSADFPGMARARRQKEMPEVAQIYFNGCAGDVTAGKFNDGDPANRPVLADKLYAAMRAAWDDTKRHPLQSVAFRSAALHLEPKGGPDYEEADERRILGDAKAATFKRNLAAMGLSYRARIARGEAIDVPAADFGKAQFLVLPAESFVHYQLTAQKLRKDCFVVTAGYGECAPGYLPSAAASAENFNHESWCWVAPGAEPRMIDAMRHALDADDR